MSQQQEDQKKILLDKNNNIEYIRGKLLGTGGFAKCFECINQENQQIYAAKVIPKKSINQKRQRYKLLVQIKIHRELKHKHIVEFIQTFQDKENVYILLQYCRNYTLKDLVKRRKRISEYETRIYIEQVVKALIYIHSQSIIHRDLKLGNILINDQMDTKICDFGLSTRVKHEGEVKKTICGTPNYIAPEILQENGHSYEVDIWSIGVIMYTLLFGKPPFEDNTVQQTYENIKTNRFKYPPAIKVSSAAKDLINRILVTDPSKRISLQDILDHQFMKIKEQLPKGLPAYTLAIPPFKFMEIENKVLSLHETQIDNSGQLQNIENLDHNDNIQEIENSLAKLRIQRQSITNEKVDIVAVYIRQCFFFENILGYLLSNGVIGIFYKSTGMNVVLEFGSSSYYIIEKNNEHKPIKKPLPSNNFELNHAMQTEYLQVLLNFKSFFASKYGLFRLDEFHKKYSLAMAAQGKQDIGDQLIYVKKEVTMFKGEILTRLNNSVIQLHFNDLTNLTINRQENGLIYYMNKKGKISLVSYQRCGNDKMKTKIRMFANLLEKLSNWNHNIHEHERSPRKESKRIPV